MCRFDADSIFLRYGDKTILSGAFLSCHKGEIVGILGRNGCGKSSFLHILNGDLRADSQAVRFNGRYCNALYRIPGAVAFLPQQSFLPLHLEADHAISLFLSNPTARDMIRRDESIGSLLGTKVRDLSGGERRYFELLLILHLDRAFFFLDEPFTELDPVHSALVMNILRLRRNSGIIVTDHDYRNILEVSDRLLLLQNGELVPIRDREHLEKLGYLPEERKRCGSARKWDV